MDISPTSTVNISLRCPVNQTHTNALMQAVLNKAFAKAPEKAV